MLTNREQEPKQSEDIALSNSLPEQQQPTKHPIIVALLRLAEGFETKDKDKNGPNKAFGEGRIWG